MKVPDDKGINKGRNLEELNLVQTHVECITGKIKYY